MIVAISLAAPFSAEENQTVMYLLLILLSMTAVIRSCYPFTKLRTFLCVTMVIGTFTALALFTPLFEISAVTGDMLKYLAAAFGLMLVVLLLLLAGKKYAEDRRKDRSRLMNRTNV